MVVSVVVCCLVSGLSWPWFELSDVASAWEGVSISAVKVVILCFLCSLGLDEGPSSRESSYSLQQEFPHL